MTTRKISLHKLEVASDSWWQAESFQMTSWGMKDLYGSENVGGVWVDRNIFFFPSTFQASG